MVIDMVVVSGIYTITNTINGKVYVGSSINVHSRWHHHRTYLRQGKHVNPKLQNAWNKYGESAFVFAILEEVLDPTCLVKIEDTYFNTLKPFYNCVLPSFGGRNFPTPESRALMSAKLKGRTFTEDHKAKISASLVGRPYSAETRAKIGVSSKKRRHSDETKEKIRAASKGHVVTPEHRARVSANNIGKHPHSGEDNPRFDHTIYNFLNLQTGDTFEGTRHAFYTKHPVSMGMVSELVRGLRSSVKGWALDSCGFH